MSLLGGRQKDMIPMLTLADGKPSVLSTTDEQVRQLKDKSARLRLAPIMEFVGEELALMQI